MITVQEILPGTLLLNQFNGTVLLGREPYSLTVTHEFVIHLVKPVREPRAIKEIRKFAKKEIGPSTVKIVTRLNKFMLLSRLCNNHKDVPNKLYTLNIYVPVATYKN
ncbi:hypothetical protein GQX74_009605 [Glossina fuscipes]|nr:hypothetical protein GQX74_009605 [Glossina fuscipes]